MNEIIKIPSWPEPKSVNDAKLKIVSLGQNMSEHAYIIGKTLIWVKENLKHGEFEDWVNNNLWFRLRTAESFMSYAEKCDAENQLINEPHYLVGSGKVAKFAVLETPPLPEGKWDVFLADPPWRYYGEDHIGLEQHSKEEQETVLETHYPTMEAEDIAKLPIKEIVADNAVLFLWTTSPKLFEAKQVIDGWGFEYKTSMVWDKVKHNVGYYVSVRHEFLLICTKGSKLPDSHKLIDSVQTIERTKHSEKPERFYEIIEEMYQGKKIELFARVKREGWDTWGLEAPK